MATQTSDGISLRTETLTGLHWAGVVLAAITGVIHLWLGVSFAPSPLGIAFLVATVGFFGGVAAVLVDYRRRLMYLLGIPFTAGQVVLWYVANAPDFGPPGIADKIVQVLLIAVLIVLYRQSA
ncbi:DUF7475 family protein [Halobellus rarus]|uniref:Uncharacterized protein n=1 Tax=Halobellus rarus TaxID=1126237 RepID=A0ABD6CQ07_9EURY|nr:hypothetical protein [Halobellus rarus]